MQVFDRLDKPINFFHNIYIILNLFHWKLTEESPLLSGTFKYTEVYESTAYTLHKFRFFLLSKVQLKTARR